LSIKYGEAVSRNAVIGKIYRKDISRNRNLTAENLKKAAYRATKAFKALRPKAPSRARLPARPKIPAQPRHPIEAVPFIEEKVGKSLFDLRACDCRWPMGLDEDGALTYCGLEAVPESSYCLDHRKMSVNPNVRRRSTRTFFRLVHR
jgi:hypothetical protein